MKNFLTKMYSRINRTKLAKKPFVVLILAFLICSILSFLFGITTTFKDLISDTFFPLLFISELRNITPTAKSIEVLLNSSGNDWMATWTGMLIFPLLYYTLIGGFIENIYSCFINVEKNENEKRIVQIFKKVKITIYKTLLSILALRTGWVISFGIARHLPYWIKDINGLVLAIVCVVSLFAFQIFFHTLYLTQLIRVGAGFIIPNIILFVSSAIYGTNVDVGVLFLENLGGLAADEYLAYFTTGDYITFIVLSMFLEALLSYLDNKAFEEHFLLDII